VAGLLAFPTLVAFSSVNQTMAFFTKALFSYENGITVAGTAPDFLANQVTGIPF